MRMPLGYPIQLILMRQLAGYLSVPVFLVDPNGNLLFYNEPAEIILGRRFDETGKMSAEEWSAAFMPLDEASQPLAPQDLPLRITLALERPAYRRLFLRGLDGVLRHVEVAAIPIAGLQGDFLGAVAFFWRFQIDAGDTFRNPGVAADSRIRDEPVRRKHAVLLFAAGFPSPRQLGLVYGGLGLAANISR